MATTRKDLRGRTLRKARCSAVPISGMRILTQTRWGGANNIFLHIRSAPLCSEIFEIMREYVGAKHNKA